jgi:hypothetical protein
VAAGAPLPGTPALAAVGWVVGRAAAVACPALGGAVGAAVLEETAGRFEARISSATPGGAPRTPTTTRFCDGS